MLDRVRSFLRRPVLVAAEEKALATMQHDPQGGEAGAVFVRLPWEGRDRSEMRREVGDGLESSALMAPVLYIARNFPEARAVLATDTPKGRVLDFRHRFVRLLERPNPPYSGTVLWFATMVEWCLTGNAYWLKIRNRGGTGDVVQLWFTPGAMLQPRWPRDGSVYISHYEYAPGDGKRYALDPRDVVHLRHGLNPRNTRLGLSPLDAVLGEVFTDEEAARFTAHVLKNLGVVGFIVTPAKGEPKPDEDSLRATKAYIEAATTGENRGRPLALGAASEVHRIEASLQGLDLAAVRNIPEERVCAMLGIPAAVVGFGSGMEQTKVGATMRELRAEAWHGCLSPTQRLIAEQLDSQLLSDFESIESGERYTFWDRSEVAALREDETAKNARILDQLSKGAITLAEARRDLGREADRTHELYFRPVSIFEVPATALPGETERPGSSSDPDAEARGMNGHSQKAGLAFEVKRAARYQARVIRLLDEARPRLERAFRADVKRALEVFGEELEALARDVLGKDGLAGAEVKADGPLDADAVRAMTEAARIADAARIQAFSDILAGVYGSHYLRVFESSLGAIEAGLGGIALDLPDDVARRVFETGGRRLGLVDLDGQTRDRLFGVIREQRAAGQNPLTMARRIRDLVPAGPWSDVDTRAHVIARTETLHAQRTSTLEAYTAAENVTAVMLFDDRIGYGDADCVERNGRVVTFAEAQEAMAEEHPNGTLSFAPVVGGGSA